MTGQTDIKTLYVIALALAAIIILLLAYEASLNKSRDRAESIDLLMAVAIFLGIGGYLLLMP